MREHSFPVRRRVPRFSFVAEVEVTALHNGTRLVSVVSELSAQGCYVDTVEGFSLGTELGLCIRYGGSKCVLTGRVVYKHDGWGMGVVFDEMTAEQRYVVDAWLAELARKAQSFPAPSSSVRM